jgi:hypothetical protein
MSGHILGPIFCAAHNCLRNYACEELGPVFLMCFFSYVIDSYNIWHAIVIVCHVNES